MKPFVPLPRTADLHVSGKNEPGRDELLLCDVVQSFEASGFKPSHSGSGNCYNTVNPECTACALTALVGHGDGTAAGNYDSAAQRVGINFDMANGWDARYFDFCECKDEYVAGFAAWEAMHTLNEETSDDPAPP